MSTTLFPGQFQPYPSSFQSIALTNSAAVSLTLPTGVNGTPKYALVQAVTNSVNWRDDGVAPTASVGGGMVLGTSLEPEGFNGNLSAIKFISTNAGGSTLLVSYYY